MRKQLSLLLAIGISVWGLSARAERSASTTATAAANVITSISISKLGDMSFGEVTKGDTVTLTPATGGGCSCSNALGGSCGGTATIGGSGVAPQCATFTVAGQASHAYTVTVTAPANLTNAANNLPLSGVAFFGSSLVSGVTGSQTLPVGGSHTLAVGAKVTVGAAQVVANYTGTITVAVTYP